MTCAPHGVVATLGGIGKAKVIPKKALEILKRVKATGKAKLGYLGGASLRIERGSCLLAEAIRSMTLIPSQPREYAETQKD